MGVCPGSEERAAVAGVAAAEHAGQISAFSFAARTPAELFDAARPLDFDEIEREGAVTEVFDRHARVRTESRPDRVVREVGDHGGHEEFGPGFSEEVELGRVLRNGEDEILLAVSRIAVAEVVDRRVDRSRLSLGLGFEAQMTVFIENLGAVDVALFGDEKGGVARNLARRGARGRSVERGDCESDGGDGCRHRGEEASRHRGPWRCEGHGFFLGWAPRNSAREQVDTTLH